MMLERVKAGHFQVAVGSVERHLLKARKTSAAVVCMIARRIEDGRLQGAVPVIAAGVGFDDVGQLIYRLMVRRGAFRAKCSKPPEIDPFVVCGASGNTLPYAVVAGE